MYNSNIMYTCNTCVNSVTYITISWRQLPHRLKAVHGEIKQQDDVTSYETLLKSKFDDALHILTQRYRALTGSASVTFLLNCTLSC